MASASGTALTLSGIIAALAAFASAGGLLLPDLYHDNALVVSTWQGNDLVTLAVAVPLLLATMILSARGSVRARLVWVGLLDYVLYNSCFYLFGAAFNLFFLVYAALLALSIWAIVLTVTAIDVPLLARRFSALTPVRLIASYMLLVGLGLAGVYVSQWLGFATSGEVPPVVARTGHPTNVVFALDLSLVIPVLVVGSVWLWQRRPWGYLFAVVVNVKSAIYMLALCAATVTAFRAGTVAGLAEIALWGTIGIGSLLAVIALLALYRPAG